MKTKIFLAIFLLSLTSCSLIPGGPSSTVKKFMEAAREGDVEGKEWSLP
jgi:hypothetical protein